MNNMFFFFFFDEQSIYEKKIVKEAFELVLIRKIKSDKYYDMSEFINPKNKKDYIIDMLTKIQSPIKELFKNRYPNIENALEEWNMFEGRTLDKEYSLSYQEAWSIIYWIYNCYENKKQREEATKKMLGTVWSLYDLDELKFYKSFIYLKNELDINTISSVAEFCRELKYIEKEGNSIFYRGHSDTSFLLLPSIMRKKEWYKHEQEIYNEIIIECPEEFSKFKNHLEYLVHMQHYGIPTRLLDITKNPLVALYFACEDLSDKNGEMIVFSVPKNEIKYSKSDTVSILSCLSVFDEVEKGGFRRLANSKIEKKKFNEEIRRLVHEVRLEKPAFLSEIEKEELLKAYFVLPEKNNKRIIKQDGAFIICGLIDEKNNVINNYKYKENDKIQIYIIESKNKNKIIKELDKLSISKAVLFPEIEEVAEYIKKKY